MSLDLFYNSMSSVLAQWSDFRVSRNLYRPYFNMQKAKAGSSSETQAAKTAEKKTSSSKAYQTADKLKSTASALSASSKSLETAFAKDAKTGEPDTEKAYNAAKSFIDSYNGLYSAIRGSGNKSLSAKSEFMSNMTTAYGRALGKAGITRNADGTLSIDREKFESASCDELDAIFGSKGSFASFASGQADSLAKYAETDAYLKAGTYTKTDILSKNTSAYSSSVSGYLYDRFF